MHIAKPYVWVQYRRVNGKFLFNTLVTFDSFGDLCVVNAKKAILKRDNLEDIEIVNWEYFANLDQIQYEEIMKGDN